MSENPTTIADAGATIAATRRAFSRLMAATLLGLASLAASAQDAKPIRLIVITAPGGSADFMARFVADKLGPRLGRTVIVENRPGAGGNIASEFVARSPADGNTLLVTSNNHTINPLIFARPGYDAAKDFAPVIQLSRGPIVLAVGAGSSAHNLQDYVAMAKAKAVSGSYGTYGVGGAAHLVGEMFKDASGANLQHVAYRGAGPAITDALGGQIPAVFISLASATPHIKSGKLRPLAIASAERWPAARDIPTIAESGYKDIVYDVWLGVLAPAGTPRQSVDRLNAEIAAILATPQAQEAMGAQGMEPVGRPSADFAAYLQQEALRMARIVKANHITAE